MTTSRMRWADVVATKRPGEGTGYCPTLKLLGPIHKDDVVAIISIVEKWARGPRLCYRMFTSRISRLS